MSSTTDSLEFYDLSHGWGHGMPQWPSSAGVTINTQQWHAMDGQQVLEFDGIMHRGTHMDAPIHVTENTPGIGSYPTWRLCGTGVAVSIPKGKWGGDRYPLVLAHSTDGINWQSILTLEEEEGEYSYPAIIKGDDNTLHICYTWKREKIKYVEVKVN